MRRARSDEAGRSRPPRCATTCSSSATDAGAGKELRVFGLAERAPAPARGRLRDERHAATRARAELAGVALRRRPAGWCSRSATSRRSLLVVRGAVDGRRDGRRRGAGRRARRRRSTRQVAQACCIASASLQRTAPQAATAGCADYADRRAAPPSARADAPASRPRLRDGIALEGVSVPLPGHRRGRARRRRPRTCPRARPSRSSARTAPGKTTLVKLLCGSTSRPPGGSPSTASTSRRSTPSAWRARIVGRLPGLRPLRAPRAARRSASATCAGIDDDAGASRAALDRARRADVVDGSPAGLETQLGKSLRRRRRALRRAVAEARARRGR